MLDQNVTNPDLTIISYAGEHSCNTENAAPDARAPPSPVQEPTSMEIDAIDGSEPSPQLGGPTTDTIAPDPPPDSQQYSHSKLRGEGQPLSGAPPACAAPSPCTASQAY